jgi:hemoglobin
MSIHLLRIVTLLLTLGGCASERTLAPPNLYERLGSLPVLELVVEDFVANVGSDPRISPFFQHSHKPKLKRWLVEFVCVSIGGPCRYTGRPMKSSHKEMGITEADFNALVENLVKALDKHQVSGTEKQELLMLLGGLKDDIVTR